MKMESGFPSEGRFREDTPLAPNSPYSASKASADLRKIVDAVAGPAFPAPRPAPLTKWF